MSRNQFTFRPAVESLDERSLPGRVSLGISGTLDITGTGRRDRVSVFYDNYGDVVVAQRGYCQVFSGAMVTGINFWGYGGNDYFCNDTYLYCYANGGYGCDYLYGGYYDDVLIGGAGVDYIYGGLGADGFYGGFGIDYFYIDAYDPVPFGGWGFDVCYGPY